MSVSRELGKTGVKIPVIGLGCMGMSEFYGSTDEEENLKVLNRAIDIKCTFWDTADMYGPGKNEILLSKVLKDRRNEVFLCTKFGNVRGENGEFLGVKGTPEYVHEACEKSLQRLDVDCIDLYYQHRVDKNVPIEDTVRAMAELVKQGKVKYLGLSECSANTLRRAYKIHPIAAVQIEYSPWSLDIETNGLKEVCEELGVTIVAYSPLGRGFLSGKYKSEEDFEPDDFRRTQPRFTGENFVKNLELVKEIEKLAKKKGVTSSQLCLSWVLAQGENIVAIPGTKKIKYLEENFQAANINLTSEELAEIRKIINSIGVAGGRYSEAATKVKYILENTHSGYSTLHSRY
ncbi:10128_t:CDS:2 [Dentiscutata erythropus]|uniref:10128_t:CDS:1 n=1 Tax=Dentiscutata erythropus TaxID=1348616 RepID=A0A9N9GE21_9GLOM|nr:10128_t:CDS:2 [Dentiscutata erythropus]